MGSVFLPHLKTGWHVDQAILHDQDRLVVIRFGRDHDKDYEVPDFNEMYELYDPMTIMFFYQNKHILCDFSTGDNNKMNFVIHDDQEMIDIIETIFRGARKGKGLVVSPYDYSYKRKK
ncbi:probable Spliceosomal protein DIB1 [Saccharomycodes ludwigii]|uniref:Probable Spliceosomal protein DIB1 n=1 Tax=Saccharomycodes ludwigii TaxID=36035 RepID=A0A376B6U3_9ASCO|nr:probable Spliceosomal protein DIB1 [Saccharomycodes ludwigii]